MEQLPSVRREEVKIHPLLAVQLIHSRWDLGKPKIRQSSRVGTNWDDAATLTNVETCTNSNVVHSDSVIREPGVVRHDNGVRVPSPIRGEASCFTLGGQAPGMAIF